jgi:D-alanyl-D-alanine carboxypeptidase
VIGRNMARLNEGDVRRAFWALAAVMFAAMVAVALRLADESVALAPAAGAAGVSIKGELRGLVAMPGGPPGAIAIVQRPGSIAIYHAGVSDTRARAPVDPQLYMRLASTS